MLYFKCLIKGCHLGNVVLKSKSNILISECFDINVGLAGFLIYGVLLQSENKTL